MSDITHFVPLSSLKTSVLFLVFNRLDTTKEVFDAIRKAKPPRLYIAADGARDQVSDEVEIVQAVRSYILSNIDWECDVKTLFRDRNLGCQKAVSGAISWFFESEEMGIILEDDCLPTQSFFWYCEELLRKYVSDTRVMHIAGMTYVSKKDNPENVSYHFARVGGIWGWASWRRAWDLYELEMESYSQAVREKLFDNLFLGEMEMKLLYESWFRKAYGNTYTWDYQWTYTKLINSTLNIMPAKNLVRNIGHGNAAATHTNSADERFSGMELFNLEFPLIHPKFVVIDRDFNYKNFKYATHVPINKIIKQKLVKLLPRAIILILKKIMN